MFSEQRRFIVAEIIADIAQRVTNDKHIKKPNGMYKVDVVDTNFNIKLDVISKQIKALMKEQAQPSPIVHSINDNARNPWTILTEEANFLRKKKSDLRPDMQDSLVRYTEKVDIRAWVF